MKKFNSTADIDNIMGRALLDSESSSRLSATNKDMDPRVVARLLSFYALLCGATGIASGLLFIGYVEKVIGLAIIVGLAASVTLGLALLYFSIPWIAGEASTLAEAKNRGKILDKVEKTYSQVQKNQESVIADTLVNTNQIAKIIQTNALLQEQINDLQRAVSVEVTAVPRNDTLTTSTEEAQLYAAVCEWLEEIYADPNRIRKGYVQGTAPWKDDWKGEKWAGLAQHYLTRENGPLVLGSGGYQIRYKSASSAIKALGELYKRGTK